MDSKKEMAGAHTFSFLSRLILVSVEFLCLNIYNLLHAGVHNEVRKRWTLATAISTELVPRVKIQPHA